MKLVPKVLAARLGAVPAEVRLVIFRGQVALASSQVDQTSNSQSARNLAVIDNGQFVRILASGDEEVLAIPGPYILEPDLTAYHPDRLGPTAGLQLFVIEDKPCIVLHPGSTPGWRIFNIDTGIATSSGETDLGAFTKWRLGVTDAEGKPQWAMTV